MSSKTFADWYAEQKSSPPTHDSSSLLPTFMTNSAASLQQRASSLMSFEGIKTETVWGMGYAQRFKFFVMLLILSVVFFLLGFLVGLPALALRPQKFAISFTMGSVCFMLSFALLVGPKRLSNSMIQPERMPFTFIYVTSMLMTLYATFTVGGVVGYFMVLGSASVQILALLWYLVTFLPGGAAGMKVVTNAVAAVFRPIMSACGLCLRGCFKAAFGRNGN